MAIYLAPSSFTDITLSHPKVLQRKRYLFSTKGSSERLSHEPEDTELVLKELEFKPRAKPGLDQGETFPFELLVTYFPLAGGK